MIYIATKYTLQKYVCEGYIKEQTLFWRLELDSM